MASVLSGRTKFANAVLIEWRDTCVERRVQLRKARRRTSPRETEGLDDGDAERCQRGNHGIGDIEVSLVGQEHRSRDVRLPSTGVLQPMESSAGTAACRALSAWLVCDQAIPAFSNPTCHAVSSVTPERADKVTINGDDLPGAGGMNAGRGVETGPGGARRILDRPKSGEKSERLQRYPNAGRTGPELPMGIPVPKVSSQPPRLTAGIARLAPQAIPSLNDHFRNMRKVSKGAAPRTSPPVSIRSRTPCTRFWNRGTMVEPRSCRISCTSA